MRSALAGVAFMLAASLAGAAPKSHGGVVDFYVTQDGCVVLASGKLACWGPDRKHDEPRIVDGVANAVGIGALMGMYLILADGSLQSVDGTPVRATVVESDGGWSIDTSGRVLMGLDTPTAVDGIAHAIALADGENHTCFVQRDGRVVCRGSNGYGQLGIRPKHAQDNPDLAPSASKPQVVPGITDAVGVACGSEHTCVLRRGGTVVCFGSGYQGNLGDGKDSDAGVRRVTVPGVTDAIAVAAADGGWTTCALRKSGRIHCWGSSYDWMSRDEQQRGFDLPALARVVKIRLTTDHVCALTEAGEVHCIGSIMRVDGAQVAKTWRKVYP